MANTYDTTMIAFSEALDKKLTLGLKSNALTSNQTLKAQFVGVGQVKVPRMTTSGLGNMDNDTYPATGGITVNWDTHTLSFDRGRPFEIGYREDEEHANIAAANAMGTFIEDMVTPEVDALRFAKLATLAGYATNTALSTSAAVVAAIDAAEARIKQVAGLESCALYINSTIYNLLKAAPDRDFGQRTDVDHTVLYWDNMRVEEIPNARFTKDAVAATDSYTVGSQLIDFIICKPGDCQGIIKHEKMRMIPWEQNQTSDKNKYFYRLWHDLIIPTNKRQGIVANYAAAQG